mmetsp:Transcript_11338/g.24495  ORF Transcript_11338/g.24495 Transcript_11338/m.24495 type:complete len:267 (+) Transcript_11338:108-908(+)
MAALSAQLTAFHTASAEHNPFTVYVVTVKKGGQQWSVYRRYREWEELRIKLIQQLGSAPPMPPKQLFGRMRPEVIENRVLGLNHFLQLCLSTPIYASHRALEDFLTRQKNTPPEGLDPSLLEAPLDGAGTAAGNGSAGLQQQQLNDIVNAASQALISVSQEPPALDAAYLHERSRMYASAIAANPSMLPPGVKVDRRIPLAAPPASTDVSAAQVAAVASSVKAMLAAQPVSAEHTRSVKQAAAAASTAVARPLVNADLMAPVVLPL